MWRFNLGAILFLVSLTSHAQIYKAELIANGLTCSMCSNATYSQLKTISFLDSISTDVEHAKFVLYFHPTSPFDLRIIKSKVEDAGFSVGSLVLFTDLENLAVESGTHHTFGEVTYHFIDTKKQILQKAQGIKVIDKGFVTEKEYKKYLKMSSKDACYKTGKMENVKYLYHVTVL